MKSERQSARPDAESEAGASLARTALVRSLFEAALDLPPEQRLNYVRAQCTDAIVLHEVESLLAHEQRAGDEFMKPPSVAPWPNLPTDRDQPDPFIGARVGAYTIRRLIAHGGMGAVYLAEQDRPRRDVALKIMTDGIWSRSARRRFEFETEILGHLHHPNIAQVYEAGVADALPLPTATRPSEQTLPLPLGEGRREGKTPPERESTLERESLLVPPAAPIARVHYFAMEYIPDARPIAAFCEQESLGLSDRLRLFRVVCDAVHYGHQNGVIHRDLKPDNILIDARGHVKIIDFGVARSTDCDVAATMHTEAGQLIGTLAYMSPEQCAADPAAIDTRSDVYSLGAVLFELLTGGLPYDVSHLSVPSATRVICEQPPARPSDVAARITANRRAGAQPPRHSRAGGNPDSSHNGAQPPPAVNNSAPREESAPSREVAPHSHHREPAASRRATPTDALALAARINASGTSDALALAARINASGTSDALALAARTDSRGTTGPRGTGFQPVKSPGAFDSRRFDLLASRLRGDLDTIILKCLEKDRNKRYHSVAALADDVERYLRREPISARPPTRTRRVANWIARHPVATTSVLCLAVAAGITGGTKLAVWWLFQRPGAFQLIDARGRTLTSDDDRPAFEARLVSPANRILESWYSLRGEEAIFGGDLIHVPNVGHQVVIAFNQRALVPEYRNKLIAFDARGDFRRVAWEGRIEDSDIPLRFLNRKDGVKMTGDMCGPKLLECIDIFPDDVSPGPEVVAKHQLGFSSPCAIRIYSPYYGGKVLYEFWHDGNLEASYGSAEQEILILRGLNAEGNWNQAPHHHCAVVLGVRPQAGHVGPRILDWREPSAPASSRESSPPVNEDVESAKWYRFLHPTWLRNAAGDDLVLPRFQAPLTTSGEGACVRFGVSLKLGRWGTPGVAWDLDANGNEVPGSRTKTTGLSPMSPDPELIAEFAKRGIDPDAIHLGPAPDKRCAECARHGVTTTATSQATVADPP